LIRHWDFFYIRDCSWPCITQTWHISIRFEKCHAVPLYGSDN
jgi:hypothetical protein